MQKLTTERLIAEILFAESFNAEFSTNNEILDGNIVVVTPCLHWSLWISVPIVIWGAPVSFPNESVEEIFNESFIDFSI